LLEGEWQLELAGATDAAAIAATWRDLQLRFPDMMARRTVAARKPEHDGGGLRVFLARFATASDAEIACARLREQHIACRAIGPGATPDGALQPAPAGKPAPVTHQPALSGRAAGMARLP
jgi:hypothetical protein